MATLAAVAARRETILAQTPAPSQAASLISRRGFADAVDHHGPPKVNFWEDPISPSKWKEEHVNSFLFIIFLSVLPFIFLPQVPSFFFLLFLILGKGWDVGDKSHAKQESVYGY
ncbi:hypothetical protein DITRI_Ditri08aG0064800 [Diplodiscus trichospermus]